MKRGKRCPKDFCKINEVFYRNQEQKHPKINIKSFMHITQPRRSVSKFLRWMQHPMKFTLVMSRKMDNGQCVALIIHVSINCHFVALLPQQSVNTLTRHSVCHGDWFPCTEYPLESVWSAKTNFKFLFGLSDIRMINPSVLAWSVFMRNLLWLIFILFFSVVMWSDVFSASFSLFMSFTNECTLLLRIKGLS